MSHKKSDPVLVVISVIFVFVVAEYFFRDYLVWQSHQKAIMGNLRQVASAGQQYILETGATMVTYPQLEGDYFSSIQPVRDETYTMITISASGGTIQATTSRGTVTFQY